MSARRKLVGLALSFVAGTASACTVGAAIPVGQAEIYSAGPVVVPYSAPQTPAMALEITKAPIL